MTQPRILDEHELTAYESNLAVGGGLPGHADFLATVRHWQAMYDRLGDRTNETAWELAHKATEATRRAEAAEERCEGLREALRALVNNETGAHERDMKRCRSEDGSVCGRCADFERARALLEES